MGFRSLLRRGVDRLHAWIGDDPIGYDPIDHPDLRRMSLTQLADLPFEPYASGSEDASRPVPSHPPSGLRPEPCKRPEAF